MGLALEGGGVRCAAQAGALSALDELGLLPQVLAGCGAGAWVAALYALGLRGAELLRMILDIHHASTWLLRKQGGGLAQYLSKYPPKEGYLSLERVTRLLRWQSMDAHLQQVRMPLAILAWDVENAGVQVLSSALPSAPTPWAGRRAATVAQAVGASLAIPGLCAPIPWRGRRLAGGATLWPHLESCLAAMGATQTLRLRVLSAGDARGDALAIALSPGMTGVEPSQGAITFPLPAQAGILDFAWMEQHYRIGQETIRRAAPILRQACHQGRGRLLPFIR